ncbi:MAG: HNH endonuclease [Desulfocapsa sp.]|nr:HNH endonuclease [Desulfocapsa sp.]
MPSKFSNKRHVAFKKQSGLCYYCGSPMWESKPKEFANKHKITRKYAARFQCTAEHLLARCDGGKDQKSNIAAACLFCNSTRHQRKSPPAPLKYKTHIQKRLKKGKWHPKKLRHLVSPMISKPALIVSIEG